MSHRPARPERGVRVDAVALGDGVGAWFTGRPSAPGRGAGAGDDPPTVGVAGNLSHRRPHEPGRLARDRADVCARIGLQVEDLHLMQQVHGRDVGVVGAATPRGAELRQVDALVTAEPGRALVVQVADCVPLLLASDAGPVAAVHGGRRGLALGVVPAALAALERLGAAPATLRAASGPAIGGCCYEVPARLRDAVAREHPVAAAETTWGTPSLDLPAAVHELLRAAGVADVVAFGACTRCDTDQRWFSHRADAATGRQAGIVVRRGGQVGR